VHYSIVYGMGVLAEGLFMGVNWKGRGIYGQCVQLASVRRAERVFKGRLGGQSLERWHILILSYD